MNHIKHGEGNAAMLKQNPAYDRAQSAIGQPASDTLQVDESVNSLGEQVEYHIEIVRALLRRLHPVTGDFSYGDPVCAEDCKQRVKVPLAQRVDNRCAELHGLTTEVQAAIRALQI